MKKSFASLLLLFLFGCTSFGATANVEPSKIPSSVTPTKTAAPTFTPTITPTPTLTPTPTPASISLKNANEIVVIKKFDTDNRGRQYFSPDLKTYYTETEQGVNITVWDTDSGKELFVIPILSPRYGYEAVFSPDSKILAISQYSHPNLGFWDIEAKALIREIDCFPYKDMAFSPDMKTIFTGYALCDVTTGEVLHKFNYGSTALSFLVAYSPDGKIVASISDVGRTVGKHEIVLWDVETGEEIHRFDGNIYPSNMRSNPIYLIAFSPDGKTLASVDMRSTIIIWDIATGEKISVFDPVSRKAGISTTEEVAGWTHSLAFSPDGRILAVGYSEGSILLWDVATTQPILLIPSNLSPGGNITSLAFSSDGTTLFTQNGNSFVVKNNIVGILWGLVPGQKMFPPPQTPAPLRGTIILDITDVLPATEKGSLQVQKSSVYPVSLSARTYSISLNTDDNNNICYLVWQVRPASDPNNRAFAYGDSNVPGSFNITAPGDYLISVGRAYSTDQCQKFSFTLQVAGP